MEGVVGYLRPYKWEGVGALASIILKAGADVLGPYLTKIAIDKYLSTSSLRTNALLDRWLSSRPLVGGPPPAGLSLGAPLVGCLLGVTQTYLMQWTGQHVRFDL